MAASWSCLVVDDSRAPRAMARRMLEGLGSAAQEAEDGAETLEACRAELREAVPLDRGMPVVDRLEFLLAAQAEFSPERPVVVLCTTDSSLEQKVEALQAGTQECIMKPCDEEVLRDKLVQVGLRPMDVSP